MNLRRILAEAAILVGLAVACALVANLLAGRERKLAIPGSYGNALVVPARTTAPVPPATPESPNPQPPPTTPFASATSAPPAALPAVPAPGKPGPAAGIKASPTPAASEQARAAQATPATKTAAAATTAKAATDGDILLRFPPHHKPFVEISGEDALWLHARGALVLDARRTKVFEAGHIAGARSVPVWESDVAERITALVEEGRDGRLPVVLYCAGGECEDSHLLAEKLFGAGFENLLVYRDGWPDWQRRGGPSAAGGRS